eukprot:15444304-Alexandrium_andersonii.AAC.1
MWRCADPVRRPTRGSPSFSACTILLLAPPPPPGEVPPTRASAQRVAWAAAVLHTAPRPAALAKSGSPRSAGAS